MLEHQYAGTQNYFFFPEKMCTYDIPFNSLALEGEGIKGDRIFRSMYAILFQNYLIF
jgi:hypothetical protein